MFITLTTSFVNLGICPIGHYNLVVAGHNLATHYIKEGEIYGI